VSAEPPDRLREAAIAAVRRIQIAGHTAYWAGGCVRDLLCGRPPKDYDIATSALPDEILRLFPEAVAVGKSFGVVRAPIGEAVFEIATFRKDHAYRDGRHPEAVSFTDAETDARRRDFTINAMFYDPVAERVLDYAGGKADLAARLVRCVGVPAERLIEDHLRMLRAARFSATLDFTIDPETADAIRANAKRIAQISAERIQQELTRILIESHRPGDAVRLLDDLGLLRVILPEVAALKGQAQPPEFHPEGDVFEHTLLMLNRMEQRAAPLAYAVLLHDVGKPPTASLEQGRVRFPNHAGIGAGLAEAILRRLRLSSADVAAVSESIRNHMRFADVREMRPSTLRRMVGADTFDLELELHRLDCVASHGKLTNHDFLVQYRDQLRAEPVLPEPWVRGDDIIRLGIPEGPDVGRWRRLAYDAQLEKRFPDRTALLEWLALEIGASGRPG
jgi:poly(A) polymerase